MINDISKILLSCDDIERLTNRIAKDRSQKNQDGNLLMICILKGSFMFFADIVRKLSVPCEVDFMQASSYGCSTVSSGKINILKDISISADGKNVVVVDDILDTGCTLYKLREYFLEEKNAKSVTVCTLLDKPARRSFDIIPNYKGCEIPDEFVVGYGLDYDEYYRNLPFVGILKREIYEKSE